MIASSWLKARKLADVKYKRRLPFKLLAALTAAALALPLRAPSTPGTAGSQLEPNDASSVVAISFSAVPAIWPHTDQSLPHEVALFRHTFSTEAPLAHAQLAVFADTRYEMWLDGVKVGRGPARFSRQTHEYDEYTVASFSSGSHVLAALVQWSPNTRRSESERPMLQMRLTHNAHVLAQTSTNWKAIRSAAWNAAAAPVHDWQLIGATELLDLNQLPADWMLFDFDDSSWNLAQLQPISTARYRPRSIPLLANISVRATVTRRGVLASGQTLVELQPNANGEQRFSFEVAAETNLVVETLPSSGASAPREIQLHEVAGMQSLPLLLEAELDGARLAWTTTDDWHPDIRRTSTTLHPGPHTLLFRNVPSRGWPVVLSGLGVTSGHSSIKQNTHVGRRLLLSRPSPSDDAIAVESGPNGHMLTFNRAPSRAPSFAVLDLGRVVHGRLEAQVKGAQGTVVDIGWAERLWRESYPLPHLGSLYPEWNQTDSWVLDGSLRRMTTIDARAGRYVLIAVWGDAPVRLREVRVIEERYPVTAQATFTSSDAQLNEIWRVGRDTAMLNMIDAYTDPWRERGQWWGDATVIDRVNEAVFGDNALMRRGLLLMAEQLDRSPRASMATHPDMAGNLHDYGMLWVQSVRRYVERTGDTSILPECYPAVQRFMVHLAQLEHPKTGLLDIPKLNWWETALIDWAAFYNPTGSVVHGQSTPVNAMYYGTLRDAVAIAQWMRDAPFETAWLVRARQVRERINDMLYLRDQKRYASSIIDGVVVSPTLFAQAWPLAYDVVPSERMTDTVNALLELISYDPTQPNVQPYGMFWVLEALGRTGHVDEGIALIKLYYGHLLARGATTWWETWDADGDQSKSLSHGWGSAPTWFLSQYAANVHTEP